MATLSTEESLCADLGRVTSLTQSIKGGCREGFFTSESASGLVREQLWKASHNRSVASAPSEARLCQSGAGPDPGSPGQTSGTACCVVEGNDNGEAYTGR